MLNLRPSVWIFARRWLASRCRSPSPSTLGLTSPSPWTPGGKKSQRPRRRRRPHQLWDEMLGGEKSFWGRSSMIQLLRKLSCVTIVRTPSNPKMAWRFIRKWTQPQQHLTAWGSRQTVLSVSLPPPSWIPAGRSPQQYPLSVKMTSSQHSRNLLQDINHHPWSVTIVICTSLGLWWIEKVPEWNLIMFALVTPDAHIMRKHKNVIIQTVTYRPVWPAVSAPDFYCNVYRQCVFTDVTQIKMTYLLTLNKCLKGHKSQGLLLGGVLKMSVFVFVFKIFVLIEPYSENFEKWPSSE